MRLFLDGDSAVQRQVCLECGADYRLVKSFVLNEDGPHAIVFSALHNHSEPEAWIDVVFGHFKDPATDIRYTFGCRVGPVPNSQELAATAVDAAAPYGDSATFGHRLSREEALAHAGIQQMWRVVDFILEAEGPLRQHVHGHGAVQGHPSSKRWRRRR